MRRPFALLCHAAVLLAALRWSHSTGGFLLTGPGLEALRAMTGDIELGMLASVNDEVPPRVKRLSMTRLRDFEARTGYRVRSVVSAHLNDVRQGVNWPALFEC